jgi:hypothetical protein
MPQFRHEALQEQRDEAYYRREEQEGFGLDKSLVLLQGAIMEERVSMPCTAI